MMPLLQISIVDQTKGDKDAQEKTIHLLWQPILWHNHRQQHGSRDDRQEKEFIQHIKVSVMVLKEPLGQLALRRVM